MKRIRIIFNILKQAAKNIFHNIFMFFASVIVVFAVLIIVGSIVLASRNVHDVIRQFSDRAEVQINFTYNVSEETAQEYADEIANDYRVESVKLISKEENLENLLSYYKDEKDLFEQYRNSERLKFVTLEVGLKEYADGESFVAEAEQLDGVDNVKDIVGTINKMEVAGFWLTIGTILAAIVVVLLSVLLIFNTVKLTVIAKKNEIEIMKYIGATDSYISAPFVIEGIVTGFVGAVLAYFVVQGVYQLIYNSVTTSGILETINLLTFAKAGGIWMFAAFAAFGMVSGLIASIIAVNKYVNV